MNIVHSIRFAWLATQLSYGMGLAPEQIAVLQQRRLRKLLRHVVARSPFYQAKYRGLDLDHLALTELPPSNKKEFMANFDQAVTDPRLRRADLERFLDDPANVGRYYLDQFIVSHTSGSQGQPMLLVQDRRPQELLYGIQMTRGHSRGTTVVEAVRRFFDPARLAVVTLKRGFYPSAVVFEYMPAVAKPYLRVLRLSQTDPDVVDQLHAFRPTILTGYAGVLEMLARKAQAGELRLAPTLRQIVNNSEKLTEQARARIEAAFGLHVLDNYAIGECPFLSTGCLTDEGAHVNADWVIFEVVDAAYQPVPPGAQGQKILITNLANTVQPIIRYEITDMVRMATAPCRCGSQLPRIARIEGRTTDAFWVRDGAAHRQLPATLFKHAFDHLREVREWQAVQVERNRIRIKLELLPGAAFQEGHIRWAVQYQLDLHGLGELVAVDLETVPALAADPATGKFRRTVSLVGAPEGVSEPAPGQLASISS
jgi:phenylacetate-coenzyme A ligase PaaK-like adenylate-forming protein